MTPPGWKCTKRVGFLFPHPCTRLTPEGCQDCQNGQIVDPYVRRTDRYGYDDYDIFDDSLFDFEIGSALHDRLERGFTEADGESMIMPQDAFEDDLTAS
jgi:hypothetical protein